MAETALANAAKLAGRPPPNKRPNRPCTGLFLTLPTPRRKWRPLACRAPRIDRAPTVGAVAQLGERLVRNEEVSGSIPLGSTNHL